MAEASQTKYRTADLKYQLDKHGNQILDLERSDIIQTERLIELRRDIDEHAKNIKLIEKFTIEAGQAVNVGKWMLLAFGLSIIALIWSLITGQAILVFP